MVSACTVKITYSNTCVYMDFLSHVFNLCLAHSQLSNISHSHVISPLSIGTILGNTTGLQQMGIKVPAWAGSSARLLVYCACAKSLQMCSSSLYRDAAFPDSGVPIYLAFLWMSLNHFIVDSYMYNLSTVIHLINCLPLFFYWIFVSPYSIW